jgi:hypothetical protein
MKHIRLLDFVLDVTPAKAALAHARWDEYRFRTEHPKSPHREASDIWMRYNALANLGPQFNGAHISQWYPISYELPQARELAEAVAERIGAKALGGVLLTKVPAGKQVYAHVDHGWHAEYYEKYAVLVSGNEEQSFCYYDGAFHCKEGDVFTFNNQACHWVLNLTGIDRITLIVCARTH